MKKLLSIFFLFSLCFGFAQTKDSLSVLEQQRRENNIQAGNPFKKFGYKPKIHTLSKGKYLEFHDLDSIVKIGSFTYHVKYKVITGIIQIEKRNSEATLSPDIISRWFSPDPLSEEFPSWSPYNFVYNNPIRFVDPDGRAPVDWVLGESGIYWDDNANNQATTKTGDTYLGKQLTFTFKSYIDGDLWDGPMGNLPAGDKLTSSVTLTASENDAGQLTGINATSSIKIGDTPIGTANDYFSGLGNDQNSFTFSQSKNADGTLSSYNLNFEQHASVSPIEAFGLNAMGFDVVNVAQNLKIGLSGNNLSVSAGTDVFPSATLSVNGAQLFKYNQPSFRATHGRDTRTIMGDNGMGGSITTETISRRPAPSFYTRYKN